MNDKTAHFVSTYEYYDLESSGSKSYTIRDYTPRCRAKLKDATHITIHRGYTTTTFTEKISNILYWNQFVIISWNERAKLQDNIFYEHIKSHLEPNQEVVCKICNKTYKDIVKDKFKIHRLYHSTPIECSSCMRNTMQTVKFSKNKTSICEKCYSDLLKKRKGAN